MPGVTVKDVAVSVIVPVYNRATLVPDAFNAETTVDLAVRSALAESETLEVWVIDDASTDDTWAVLQAHDDPRVRLVRLEKNGGQSAARNRGLDVARGKFVKFLDSDDVLLEGHLDKEVRALQEGADIAASGCQGEGDDGGTRNFDPPVFTSIVDDVLWGRAVPTSAALYRRRGDWRWDPTLGANHRVYGPGGHLG